MKESQRDVVTVLAQVLVVCQASAQTLRVYQEKYSLV